MKILYIILFNIIERVRYIHLSDELHKKRSEQKQKDKRTETDII